MHLRETFNCRLADIEEREKFKQLGRGEAKFKDIGLKGKYNQRQKEININMDVMATYRAMRIIDKHDIDNYNELFDFLLNHYSSSQTPQTINQLQEKLSNEKLKLKKAKEFINSL